MSAHPSPRLSPTRKLERFSILIEVYHPSFNQVNLQMSVLIEERAEALAATFASIAKLDGKLDSKQYINTSGH